MHLLIGSGDEQVFTRGKSKQPLVGQMIYRSPLGKRPELDHPIFATCRSLLSILAEPHARDSLVMSSEWWKLLKGVCVPTSEAPIAQAISQYFAVSGEGDRE